jgi:hemerythrin
MRNILYIIWQKSFEQDESILDEQHHALLATINSLYYFLQKGHALKLLMPTVKLLLSYLKFHNSTEEGILRATNYPDLDEYIQQNEQVIVELKAVCLEAVLNREPELVLKFLKNGGVFIWINMTI